MVGYHLLAKYVDTKVMLSKENVYKVWIHKDRMYYQLLY
jgi:hypothetical protein